MHLQTENKQMFTPSVLHMWTRLAKCFLALVEVILLVLREEDPSSQIKSLNGLLKGIDHITDMSKLSTGAKTFSAVALKVRKPALLV